MHNLKQVQETYKRKCIHTETVKNCEVETEKFTIRIEVEIDTG